jgi:tRNA-specific 2-thiouridylase
MKQKVLLGMSGGIDSSVAAIILQERGFEVIGISFIFSENTDAKLHHSLDSAKLMAKKLGMKHLTVDLKEEFKTQVISYFTNEYKSGRTPFPCAVCNPRLKFFNLEKYAKELSCDFISTGHYANIALYKGIKYISGGTDAEKDQSFFLWGLKPKTIQKLIFPLGEYSKSEVRKIATDNGFETLNKKNESLGICFIKGKNYRKFLKDKGLITKMGNFTDTKGNVLGKHNGIFNYTVGQRRGLGIHFNKPLFVSEINAETNEVVLSDFAEMYRTRILVKNSYFVSKHEPVIGKIYTVKIRYRLQENFCKIIPLDENRVIVELSEPVSMVAKGQTAVFYDGDRVSGGGFIEDSE